MNKKLYLTPDEEDDVIKQRTKSQNIMKGCAIKSTAKYMDKSKAIIINKVTYSSLKSASLNTGISESTLQKVYKELQKTSFSDIEKEVPMRKTFTFKKVDNGAP